MLRLLQWFAARRWHNQPISEHACQLLAPIVDIAPRPNRSLSPQCQAALQAIRDNAAERHKLCIALKKLRYTIDFLGSLFDERKVDLKSLQDDLGHANDVRVAYDLVSQIRETTNLDPREVFRAAGIVLGWHERD